MTAQINSAARALKVLKLLKGHSMTGLSNKEIATALNISPVNVSRAISILIDEGLVIQLETKRYSHSIQLLQIATAHAEEIAKTQARILEMNQRIGAGSFK